MHYLISYARAHAVVPRFPAKSITLRSRWMKFNSSRTYILDVLRICVKLERKLMVLCHTQNMLISRVVRIVTDCVEIANESTIVPRNENELLLSSFIYSYSLLFLEKNLNQMLVSAYKFDTNLTFFIVDLHQIAKTIQKEAAKIECWVEWLNEIIAYWTAVLISNSEPTIQHWIFLFFWLYRIDTY